MVPHRELSSSPQMERYISKRVAPALREPFRKMLTTEVGWELGQAVCRRRGRFIVDPTRLLGSASMTLNFLRLALIGHEVVAAGGLMSLVESVAHEASHLAQGYWSDSFEQEYKAFVSAAQVLHELGYRDSFGWTPDLWNLPLEEAARRIQELSPTHPLYGLHAVIPLRQRKGWQAVGPLFRQVWAVLWAAIRGY